MNDDIANINSPFQSIPFDHLIGDVLSSCVDAQSQAGEVARKFIEEVAYQGDPDKRKVATVAFFYQSAETGRVESINVPLLTIVPIPFLRIDTVNIAFTADIEANENGKLTVDIVNGNQKVNVDSSEYVSAKGKMEVNVTAVGSDMPLGMAKLFQVLGERAIIVANIPTSDPRTLGNDALAELLIDIEENSKTSSGRPSLRPWLPVSSRRSSSAFSSYNRSSSTNATYMNRSSNSTAYRGVSSGMRR